MEILATIGRRVLTAVPVIFGVTLVTFLALQLVPGDPARNLLFGTLASDEQVETVRAQLGLDRPLPEQYVNYLRRLVQGDLGHSYINHMPVATQIGERILPTFQLAAGALIVALLVGVPTGLVAGVKPGGWADRIATSAAVLGVSVPYYWLALILVQIFAVRLGLLPSLGTEGIRSLILPSIALGWGFAAMISRLLRSGIIAASSQDYVLAARARGFTEARILRTTVLRNASAAMVAGLGLQIGHMLAGAVAIEVVFGRRGIGSMLFNAITAKDLPTIQGGILFVSLMYVGLNLLADVVNMIIDPRLQSQRA